MRRPNGKAAAKKHPAQRKLMTIDIRDLVDVKERMTEEAHARQYVHVEPFLRRVLVKLFRDGEIDRLSI